MGKLANFDLRSITQIYGCRNLVETGTGIGTTLRSVKKFFNTLYSCEINPTLANICRIRFFLNGKKIQIFGSDSLSFLKKVFSIIDPKEPVLFWLDAHFPGMDYGLASFDDPCWQDIKFPLQSEIEFIIQNRDCSSDVFIIDDLRIYKTDNFEKGNVGPERKPNDNSIEFIRKLNSSHHIIESLWDEGYLILLPKSNPCTVEQFIESNKLWRSNISLYKNPFNLTDYFLKWLLKRLSK